MEKYVVERQFILTKGRNGSDELHLIFFIIDYKSHVKIQMLSKQITQMKTPVFQGAKTKGGELHPLLMHKENKSNLCL